jgi:hypothetical protein
MSMTNEAPTFTTRKGTHWYVMLMGGLKRQGRWTFEKDLVAVTLVGGLNFDGRAADVADPNPFLTKVSLVGGVHLVVPHDVDVVVEGFHIVGHTRVDPARRDGPARATVRVRNFCLWGGTRVERA